MATYEKSWQFLMNQDYAPGLEGPREVYATSIPTGGTVGANTYYFAVSAIVDMGGGVFRETVISQLRGLVTTTGATSTVTITWSAVANAVDYRILYSNASATQFSYWRFVGSAATSFVWTNQTWTTASNYFAPYVSYDANRYHLWWFKAFMCGQLPGQVGWNPAGFWTVVSSCDGTNYGNNDNVDYWGSTFDCRKITCPAPGVQGSTTAKSWVVLKSPPILGGDGTPRYYYLIVDYSDTGGDPTRLTYGFCVDSPPTGGNTTTAPTGTYPAKAFVSVAQTYFGIVNASAGPMRLHGMLATDGTFMVFASRNGKAIYSGMWGHVLANVRALDLYPFIAGASASNDGTTWSNSVTTGFAENNHSPMRVPNGSGYDQYGIILPDTGSQFPGGKDSFDGTWSNWPIWVSKDGDTGTNPYTGLRGRFQDIMVFPSSLWGVANVSYPAGDGTPDNIVSPKWFALGPYWVPTNTLVHI